MRPRFTRLPHATRLAAFVVVGLGITSVAAVRQARAQMHEGMRHLARQLMPYAEQGVIEAPRRVEVNGESLYLAMGTTRDSVTAALDYYESWCDRRSGHVTESIAQADSSAFGQLWTAGGRLGPRLEMVREGDETEGYVICVDVGDQRLTSRDLAGRLKAVVDTGDLSRWGNLRYAYVQRASTGTRILTVATEGAFNLLRMFPAEGDAPGADPQGLARYPGMRRVLSAREDGQGNSLGMYTARAPIGDVRAWYRGEMGRHGWTLSEVPASVRLPASVASQRDRSLTFSRGNDGTMVLVFDHADGVTSMMSLVAM
ncbi:MAG: hypothetical protein U0326_26865 [Polyangiales bacterium]